MFRIVGHKIYFNGIGVGSIEGLLGTTIFDSLVNELENHTAVEKVEVMQERLAAFEAERAERELLDYSSVAVNYV